MRYGRLGKNVLRKSGTDASIVDYSSYSLIPMPQVCQGLAFHRGSEARHCHYLGTWTLVDAMTRAHRLY
ncbi:hypothetical protein K437DRAFT_256681 [Tilletiaria anomala UBC 951]|uniref:Uncharacterized protein n=1 Tax=Tilletiaria anomala (strain ATCC 24038 / CBS 436.72 / UBC 951) TaxID=1037660 RepID=A0A066W377_TILAU|nr:uncharacterized protein K437DRAFT_256681 [Tilletiaria anomala UBC 951]KDN45235.1 hypothetical protein K437DRAFT_256681 [Tilletiaria anomala UBC 951]